MDCWFVYALLGRQNKIRYIGKARRPLIRLSSHIHVAKYKPKVYVSHWIRKEKFKIKLKILEKCYLESKAYSRERYWIQFFRKRGARLCNLTDGGAGAVGIPLTKPHKRKISRGVLRAYKNPEVLKRFRTAMASLETRKKISETRKRLCRCKKFRWKMSKDHRVLTKHQIKEIHKMRSTHSIKELVQEFKVCKNVIFYALSGHYGKRDKFYKSIK